VFPGPLHDVVSAYFRLIDDLHIPPENIVISGDSAGGALALALLLYLRDNDYPLPSGAVLMSPWVGKCEIIESVCFVFLNYIIDLTMSCESWESNSEYDVVPFPTADNHMNPIGLYLGDHTERYLTHPYASPLFGDLTGLPPLLIQAGDAEVLRDEITLAHKATLAGVPVRHELYEDAVSVICPLLIHSMRYFADPCLSGLPVPRGHASIVHVHA
jgi:acetyl esterase/lipase